MIRHLQHRCTWWFSSSEKINSIWTIRSPGVIFSLGSKGLVSRVLGVWSQLRSSNFKISRFGIYRFFANYPYLFSDLALPSLEPFFEHLEPSPSGSDHTTRSAIEFYAKNRKSARGARLPPENPRAFFTIFFDKSTSWTFLFARALRASQTKKAAASTFLKKWWKNCSARYLLRFCSCCGCFGWVRERIPSLIDRRLIASILSIDWVAGQISIPLSWTAVDLWLVWLIDWVAEKSTSVPFTHSLIASTKRRKAVRGLFLLDR